jgi:hypothetical protein
MRVENLVDQPGASRGDRGDRKQSSRLTKGANTPPAKIRTHHEANEQLQTGRCWQQLRQVT